MKIKHVYGNVLKLDIPLTIKIRTMEGDVPTEREEPFYPDVSKGCVVILGNNYNRKIQYDATVNGNVAHIEDDGVIGIGTYKVTVKCYDEYGNPYRYMVRDIIEICDATIDAGIEAGVEFDAETYTLEGAVFVSYGGGSFEQVQADWTENDIHSKAYIKNKPTNLVEDESYVHTDNNYTSTEKDKLAELENYDDSGIRQELYGKVDKVTGKGLSTNDYTNEEKSKLAGLSNYDDTAVRELIAQTYANFANYYDKEHSYSSSEIDQLLRTQREGQYVVVNSLPTASAETMFKIYLVPSSDPEQQNIKDEYITISTTADDVTTYSWELIGSTKIDLSDYPTTQEMTTAIALALNDYYTKSEMNTALGNKQDIINDLTDIRSGASAGATAYQKPSSGIPSTDLASDVQNSLGKADTALQVQKQADWNESDTDDPAFIKNKPTIPDTSDCIKKSPTAGLVKNDGTIDTNTYLTENDISGKANKSEMSVTDGTGADSDKTTIQLKSGTSATVLKSHQSLSGKQDVIDAQHKLSADLVDDTNSANKFTNATEKQTWNSKQDALAFETTPSSSNKVATMADVPTVPDNLVVFSNDNGEGIVPTDGIRAEQVNAGATISVNADVVTVVSGNVGTSAITLQVPNDNLAHVWDILMTTDSSVAITFAMSNSATILYPNGFSVGASKAVEISVIGVGTKYYLRYGEFA